MGQIPMGQIQSFQIFQTLQIRGNFCFEICGLIFKKKFNLCRMYVIRSFANLTNFRSLKYEYLFPFF